MPKGWTNSPVSSVGHTLSLSFDQLMVYSHLYKEELRTQKVCLMVRSIQFLLLHPHSFHNHSIIILFVIVIIQSKPLQFQYSSTQTHTCVAMGLNHLFLDLHWREGHIDDTPIKPRFCLRGRIEAPPSYLKQ